MVPVIGVDFSAAQTDKNTWSTEAELTCDLIDSPILKLNSPKSIRRNARRTERARLRPAGKLIPACTWPEPVSWNVPE